MRLTEPGILMAPFLSQCLEIGACINFQGDCCGVHQQSRSTGAGQVALLCFLSSNAGPVIGKTIGLR